MDQRPEPLDAAADFVAVHFPDARWAILAGSVLTPARTATSDLDLVVMLDRPPAPYRETFRHRGWVVEAFVQTEASLAHFFGSDRDRRRGSLQRMCALGVVVVDRDGTVVAVREEAARQLAAGPAPLTEGELDARRYLLSDQLDDLAGCEDVAERVWVAGEVARLTAELAVEAAGRWVGGAKWLHRALVDADPDLGVRLTAALAGQDRDGLAAAAREVLDRVGGPLTEGYRQGARLPQ